MLSTLPPSTSGESSEPLPATHASDSEGGAGCGIRPPAAVTAPGMGTLFAAIGFAVFATALQPQDTQGSPVDSGVANPSNSSAGSNLTNSSNNPVTPKTQILAQNYFMPSPQGYGGRPVDQELLRLYWPFMAFGVQNILRIYQPIETRPLFPTGRNAGLDDTTVFDLALHKLGKVTLGGGPLLVIPSGSHSNMSDGKWQAGGAGSVVTETSWGLLAAIVTYSHSFSGYGSGHPSTQVVGVQPLAHYNFNKGYYLRSSGIWNIDYGNHVSVIPIGFGAGKVTRLRSGIVMNLYVEPQRSVHHTGTGSPTWQILTAATFQFPNRAKPSKLSP
jgi:hypothetical protein